MSLEKTVYMNQLFELYGQLLTQKQAEMLALYYEEDYSLSEIADHYEISRQGVRDNIKRGESSLETYEAQLKLLNRRQKRQTYYQQILSMSNDQAVKQVIHTLIDEEYEQ